MNAKPKKLWMSLAVTGAMLLLLAVAFFRQRNQTIEVDSGTRMVLGTFSHIRLRCRNQEIAQKAIQQAYDAIAEVDRLMSTYRPDSELARVNQNAAGDPVPVSQETFDLLVKSVHYGRLTAGAFDITVTPLLKLWKHAAAQGRQPTPEDITLALQKVGYEKIELDPENLTVRLPLPGMALTVDALAKGHAVDRALAALRIPGVKDALVDIGGEVACFVRSDQSPDWILGIQDPFEGMEDALTSKVRWKLHLRDGTVATSGNYRQFVTIEGKKFSHILDPRTGQPAQMLPSVTILAPTALQADALATAVSVMGPAEGLKLIESLPDVEALLVAGTKENYQLYRSSGFGRYESKN